MKFIAARMVKERDCPGHPLGVLMTILEEWASSFYFLCRNPDSRKASPFWGLTVVSFSHTIYTIFHKWDSLAMEPTFFMALNQYLERTGLLKPEIFLRISLWLGCIFKDQSQGVHLFRFWDMVPVHRCSRGHCWADQNARVDHISHLTFFPCQF